MSAARVYPKKEQEKQKCLNVLRDYADGGNYPYRDQLVNSFMNMWGFQCCLLSVCFDVMNHSIAL